jgi:CspA family cold shock protein
MIGIGLSRGDMPAGRWAGKQGVTKVIVMTRRGPMFMNLNRACGSVRTGRIFGLCGKLQRKGLYDARAAAGPVARCVSSTPSRKIDQGEAKVLSGIWVLIEGVAARAGTSATDLAKRVSILSRVIASAVIVAASAVIAAASVAGAAVSAAVIAAASAVAIAPAVAALAAALRGGGFGGPRGGGMPAQVVGQGKGVVKFFNGQKGFGFIQREDGGEDVFVHISAVERAGLEGLAEGQGLEFTLVDRGGKISASDLVVVGDVIAVAKREPAPQRQLTGEKATGTVKFFNAMKGFGFITRDDGQPDAFVHISAVERSGMRELNEGDRLEFDIEVDRRGKYSAVNLAPRQD